MSAPCDPICCVCDLLCQEEQLSQDFTQRSKTVLEAFKGCIVDLSRVVWIKGTHCVQICSLAIQQPLNLHNLGICVVSHQCVLCIIHGAALWVNQHIL